MNRHALLKKLATHATLYAGLMNLHGTQKPRESLLQLPPHTWRQTMPPMPAARFPHMRWPQEADIEFEQAIGDHGTAEAETTANTADLIALGFGSWPPPGLDSDPALIRQRAAWNYVSFQKNPRVWGGTTEIVSTIAPGSRDPLGFYFPFAEMEAFSPAKVRMVLPPLDSDYNLRSDRSMEAHEALHAVFGERQALLDLLFPERRIDSMSASKAYGHGSKLERILASNETARQTENRHREFKEANAGAENDGALDEYPLIYTEIRSYLAQVMMDGIATRRWETLPRTPEELWAAAYNSFGGVPFQPEGGDEVSLFLNSRDGLDALRKFPAVPMDYAEQLLRGALNKLTPAQQIAFYGEVLPEIYGELLEDLGDARGLEKMGLPEAPVHALAYLHHIVTDHPGGNDNWSEKEWRAMAAQVEPITVERLYKIATANGQTEAAQSLVEVFGQPGRLALAAPFDRTLQPIPPLGGEGLHR